MLQFLFLSIIFLIFFIFILLLLPYQYAFSFCFREKLNYTLSFSLFFVKIIFKNRDTEQLLSFKIFNFIKELKVNKKNKIEKWIQNKSKKLIKTKFTNKTIADNKETSQKSEKKSKFKFDFSLINYKNFNHLFKFFVKTIKILKPDYLKLKFLFSFDDPYYNGIFLAYYYSLKNLFDYPDIKAEINWQEVIFEAEGSAGGKIVPLESIWHFLKFIFSLKSLKIFWKLYQTNSKKG